jgi:hypothetical protein
MLSAQELSSVYGAGAVAAAPARTDNKRTIASSGPKSKGVGLKLGAPDAKKAPNPAALAARSAIFDEIAAKQAAAMAALPREPINVTMPDGRVIALTAWLDSPLSVAESIGKQFAGRMCVAKLKYSRRLAGLGEVVAADEMDEDADAADAAAAGFELWDLARPFEGDCEMQLISFDEPDGRETFWHSSSHVLGLSIEELLGAQLTHGPPTSSGFFYDAYMGANVVTPEEAPLLEAKAKEIAKAKFPFERLALSKADALRLFADNPFKAHTIATKVPDGSLTTVYRCGALVDLCRGPHLPHTGRIEAFAVVKHSSSYFLGQVRERERRCEPSASAGARGSGRQADAEGGPKGSLAPCRRRARPAHTQPSHVSPALPLPLPLAPANPSRPTATRCSACTASPSRTRRPSPNGRRCRKKPRGATTAGSARSRSSSSSTSSRPARPSSCPTARASTTPSSPSSAAATGGPARRPTGSITRSSPQTCTTWACGTRRATRPSTTRTCSASTSSTLSSRSSR